MQDSAQDPTSPDESGDSVNTGAVSSFAANESLAHYGVMLTLRRSAGALRVFAEGFPKPSRLQREAADVGTALRTLIYTWLDGMQSHATPEPDQTTQMFALAQLIAQDPGSSVGDSIILPAFRSAGLHRDAEFWVKNKNDMRAHLVVLRQAQTSVNASVNAAVSASADAQRILDLERQLAEARDTCSTLYHALDNASGVVDAGEGEAYAYQAELESGAGFLGLQRSAAANGDSPGGIPRATPR